jgi:hypothetical protein
MTNLPRTRVVGQLLPRTVCLSVLALAIAACTRPQAAGGTHAGADKAAVAAEPKPANRGSPAPRAASEQSTDARTHAAKVSGCVLAERAEEIHRRLRTEAGEAFSFRRATPLLVDRWPDPTALVVYTYESRALPTGRVAYEIRSPEWKLRISPLGARVDVTHLRGIEKLGREDHGAIVEDPLSRLREAEEALVEVVGGCRTIAQACKVLAPYKTWYEANPVIGRHLTGQLGVAIPCLQP